MISTQPHLFHLACKDKNEKNCTSKKKNNTCTKVVIPTNPYIFGINVTRWEVSKLFKAVPDCSQAFVEFCSMYFNMSTDDQVNYAFMIKQNSPRMKNHVLSQL